MTTRVHKTAAGNKPDWKSSRCPNSARLSKSNARCCASGWEKNVAELAEKFQSTPWRLERYLKKEGVVSPRKPSRASHRKYSEGSTKRTITKCTLKSRADARRSRIELRSRKDSAAAKASLEIFWRENRERARTQQNSRMAFVSEAHPSDCSTDSCSTHSEDPNALARMLLGQTEKQSENENCRSLADQPAESGDDAAISECEEVSGLSFDDAFVYGAEIKNPYVLPELCCL